MTTYISSLIEPVFRHARRLSRASQDSEQPIQLSEASLRDDGIRRDVIQEDTAVQEVDGDAIAGRTMAQNEALDRVFAGDAVSGEGSADVLSPMSISSPGEADLRLLDQQRMQRMREGPFGHSDEDASRNNAEGNRSRGRTDPLPRRSVQRAANRRHISWESDSMRPTRPTRSMSSAYAPPSSLPETGGIQYINDPIGSRSVPMTSDGVTSRSSAMSLDSGAPTSPPGRSGGLALPEDDGMRAIRDRIQAIQAMDLNVDEKSKLLHSIMTEKWTAGQASLQDGLGRPQSPATASLRSQEAPTTPRTEVSVMDGLQGPSGEHLTSPSTSLFTEPPEDELFTNPEDLKPTYWKPDPTAAQTAAAQDQAEEPVFEYGDEDLVEEQEEEQHDLGCEHYKRNVKLQCADCHRWYTCRFCHDAVESHTLVRHRTRNMLCMLCGTAQPAAKTCRNCYETTAAYYCSVCKLWDDDRTKKIYHCSACGICRRGEGLGKDFFHCPTCDVCISMSIRDTHRCIERSVDCDCPICGEYMFNSPTTVVFMRCGHSIHHACYKRYLERSYRCPICAKSVLNMEMTFRNLDRAIEAQPMPEEFRGTRAIVQCNDCRCKTSVPYHWLGLKCEECESYNTAQISIVGPDGTGDTVPEGAGVPLNRNATNDNQQAPVAAAAAAASGGDGNASGLRSRTTSSNALADIDSRSRRPTSTGGIQEARPSVSGNTFFPLVGSGNRSISAMGIDRTRLTWESISNMFSSGNPDATLDDSEDNDDDEELDFWGGDLSPRLRSLIFAPDVPSVDDEDEEEEDRIQNEDEEEESDSSDDEQMNDNPDDEDAEEDEENDAVDMDIFGHR